MFKQILGIIDQPILKERWIGITGRRTALNGQEISTRYCEQLSKAYMYVYHIRRNILSYANLHKQVDIGHFSKFDLSCLSLILLSYAFAFHLIC